MQKIAILLEDKTLIIQIHFLVGAFYQNEPDFYSGKFFFRQTTECMRSGHFLQNY